MNGISVVICCYNSSKRLATTFDYLYKQKDTPFKWEVIVVDNNSKDNTGEVAIKLWDEYKTEIPLVSVFEKTPGLSEARKKGVFCAKYDIIIFCDDDNWLEESYLANSYRIMTLNNKIGICGGKGIPFFETQPPEWFNYFSRSYALGEQGVGEGKTKCMWTFGAGMIIRKNAIIKIYEYNNISVLSDREGDKLTSGGDSEIRLLVEMLGYDVWYSPKLVFKHFIPKERLSLNYLVKLHAGFGESIVKLEPLILVKLNYENSIKSNYWYVLFKHIKQFLKLYLFSSGIKRYIVLNETKVKINTMLLSKSSWKIKVDGYVKFKKLII